MIVSVTLGFMVYTFFIRWDTDTTISLSLSLSLYIYIYIYISSNLGFQHYLKILQHWSPIN